jgi:hypothetical protein
VRGRRQPLPDPRRGQRTRHDPDVVPRLQQPDDRDLGQDPDDGRR